MMDESKKHSRVGVSARVHTHSKQVGRGRSLRAEARLSGSGGRPRATRGAGGGGTPRGRPRRLAPFFSRARSFKERREACGGRWGEGGMGGQRRRCGRELAPRPSPRPRGGRARARARLAPDGERAGERTRRGPQRGGKRQMGEGGGGGPGGGHHRHKDRGFAFRDGKNGGANKK